MDHVGVLLSKIKKIPKNTNGRLAIPALAGLLVCSAVTCCVSIVYTCMSCRRICWLSLMLVEYDM